MDKSKSHPYMKARSLPIPVTHNEELDVDIISTGKGGDGVAKVSGFIIFVKGAKPGEKCKIKITDIMSKFAKAEVVK